MRRLLVPLLLGLACTEERPVAKNPTSVPPPAPVVVVATAAKDAGAIATVANPDELDGPPDAAEWLHDGTLVVSSAKEVITVDPSGKVHHLTSHGRQVRTALDGKGGALLLEGEKDLAMFDGTLREVWKGVGHALSRPGDAVAFADTVVAYRNGKLIKLELPPGKARRVETLEMVSGDKTAVVSWTPEESSDTEAGIFDIATGKYVGKAFGNGMYAARPIATIEGKVQYGLADTTIKVLDLETAAVLRSGKIACGKDQFLGNPMLSPNGDLLLVTCGMDGIVLDPKTFAVKRRHSKIMPGCDNGDVLPASFDKKKPTELVLEGCGGEARLEITTGKYKCSDDIGLVGAPYEVIMPPPRPGAPPRLPVRAAPPGRENLPHCRPADQGMQPVPISGSATYREVWDENSRYVITDDGRKIALDADARLPVLAPDESKVAYITKDKVIVRALPKGDVVREITSR